MKIWKRDIFWLGLILLVAAGLKLWLLLAERVPFNADEAVVALMARHILQGERPIFFYGQAYMGSLDAWLVAGGFAIFGQQVWVIRLLQTLLYLGTIATTYLIGKTILGSSRTGLIAAALLAVPTVNVTLYTTASLGGYGEAILIGNLMLLAVHAIGQRLLSDAPLAPRVWGGAVLWGFLAGLGLWSNALSLIYAIPSGLYLLWKLRWGSGWRRGWPIIPAALVGFLLGSLPWWLYAAQAGLGHLIGELTGSAVAVEKGSYALQILNHLFNLILLGGTVTFGFRPPWEVRWLGLPLLPFVLMFWAVVIIFMARGIERKQEHWPERRMIVGVMVVFWLAFILTSFGVDPSGRYFVPTAIPLALIAAETIQQVSQKFWIRLALIALVIGFHIYGTIQCALRYPPGITTQFYEPSVVDHRYLPELIDFLKTEGETTGYTNYWVSYPLAFESDESLIFVPRLPYHADLRYTERDDRYAPYDAVVMQSTRAAYITTRNAPLDEYLRAQFTALGITWQERQIGDYQVYYRLSVLVRPEQIGLGSSTP
ncbi:MAG TPA: glycosyltransferase family 39 protein [Anaerolineaceae bacterium]|nr:glycosyltransferase family 39 protein [Anaerolineaceae bacterium]